MKSRVTRYILIISILANIFIAIPALILSTSSGLQNVLYQGILAPRLGQPKIAFIGDSITAGGGIWALKIGEYNFDTWNFGHGGLTTKQLRHYGKKVALLHSKYAFIMAGINDDDKTIEGATVSFQYYQEILDTLIESGVEPIIQLTLYRENEESPQFIDALNNSLRKYAGNHHLSVIDLNPLLCPDKSLLPQYSKDGVHLTPEAYKVWALEIKKILRMKRVSN